MAFIVIQEDNDDLAHAMSTALNHRRHQTAICFDSAQTIALLERQQVDLVVADIFVRDAGRLQPTGGITLLGYMQKQRALGASLGDIPVLAITGAFAATGSIDVLDQAVLMGAKAVLRKPFSINEFLEKTQELL